MKKIIFFFIIILSLLALPALKASALQDVMDGVGEGESQTVSEVKDDVESAEGEYLRNIIRWIPVVGAALFVLGVLVAVLSSKSNEWRKWGIRVAAIESIIAFVIYLVACISYDKYYHVDGVTNPASQYYVDRYQELIANVRGISDVYTAARAEGKGAIVSFLQLFSYFFKTAVIPLVVICIGSGLMVCLMAQGKKNVQRWAIVGLCVVAPIAIIVGARYIIV